MDETFFGNSMESYLWFTGILLAGLILKRFISKLFSKILFLTFRKYGKSIGWDRFVALMNRPFQLLFMVLLVYFAFDRLAFPTEWNMLPKDQVGIKMVLFRIFEAATVLSAFWVLVRGFDFTALILIEHAKKTSTKADDQLLLFLKEAIKVVLGGIGLFILLGIAFNLDVISLVTGLGIGGLAIALAAKETLENLLGSFTIFMDKPFAVGDAVKVGAVEGAVESIGFRSTRIRTAEKTLVTLPNKKMVDAELTNETERLKRKAAFSFWIHQDTKSEQIEAFISKIKAELNRYELISKNLQLVSFRGIAEHSFEIYISYFVNSPDMETFLKIQEEVNFKILEFLKEEKISFPPLLHSPIQEKEKEYSVSMTGRPLTQL